MLLQRAIIFQPKRLPKNHVYESVFPLTEYFFDFSIKEEKFLINAVHLKAKKTKGLVFYLHGTLNNIQYHLSKAAVFIENNYDVVIIDYPKYGKSKGKLTEELLHVVVEISFQKTIMALDFTGDVVLVGRSLGTALASNLAAKIKPKGLILISPYYSMPDLFQHKVKMFPFKKLKFKFENHTYLPLVTCDAYIIHGNEDKLIPIVLSRKLIPFLKSPEYFIEIDKANHFDVHEKEVYKKLIRKILK
ncbi:MAG TPA: alpha/beta hydrolase [Chitinophagales bacterium]|nr:alpha/beta hydrolase [Chitinophagales bacterium]